MNVPYRAYY